MHQGRPRWSRRLQRLKHEQLQLRLAQHLHDVEAARIRVGRRRRSRPRPEHRYFIFGEEGYLKKNDPFEGEEFLRLGFRIDRRQLLQKIEGGIRDQGTTINGK
jgi:hypothetical protein